MKHLHYPVPVSLRGERLRTELETALNGPCSVSVTQDAVNPLDLGVPDNANEATVTSVLAAHSGAPTPAEVAEAQADAEAVTVFGDFTQAQMTKIRAVYAGTDTFTAAQLQKLVAGLAIMVHRRLR